jgi:hypothetical protein
VQRRTYITNHTSEALCLFLLIYLAPSHQRPCASSYIHYKSHFGGSLSLLTYLFSTFTSPSLCNVVHTLQITLRRLFVSSSYLFSTLTSPSLCNLEHTLQITLRRFFVSSTYLFNTTCLYLTGHHKVYQILD